MSLNSLTVSVGQESGCSSAEGLWVRDSSDHGIDQGCDDLKA